MNALLVDLGNTRWKLGLSRREGVQLIAQGERDDLERLDQAVAKIDADPDRVLLASVAEPELTGRIRESLEHRDLLVRQVFSTDRFPGLVVGYDEPGQLGVDRALAMLAVRTRWHGPFCIVDAGTAVTVDFVDARGRHLGGFILPGRALARECLLQGTAIPTDERTDESASLGRDTAGAISLGARYAVAGLVRQALTLPELMGFDDAGCTFVGGGDAASLLPLLPLPVEQVDQPVLQGLNQLAIGWRA